MEPRPALRPVPDSEPGDSTARTLYELGRHLTQRADWQARTCQAIAAGLMLGATHRELREQLNLNPIEYAACKGWIRDAMEGREFPRMNAGFPG